MLQVNDNASLSFIVWLCGPSMTNGGPYVKSVITKLILGKGRTILMIGELFYTAHYITHHSLSNHTSPHPIPPHLTRQHRTAPQPNPPHYTKPRHTKPHLICMNCMNGIYRLLVPITRKKFFRHKSCCI